MAQDPVITAIIEREKALTAFLNTLTEFTRMGMKALRKQYALEHDGEQL